MRARPLNPKAMNTISDTGTPTLHNVAELDSSMDIDMDSVSTAHSRNVKSDPTDDLHPDSKAIGEDESVGSENEDETDPRWDPEEFAVVGRSLNSFYGLDLFQTRVGTRERRKAFELLPEPHKWLLMRLPYSFMDRFDKIDSAIKTNYVLALDILKCGLQWAGVPYLLSHPDIMLDPSRAGQPEDDGVTGLPWIPTLTSATPCTFEDYSKASGTIRHFYREWSAEGSAERQIHLQPLLDYLEQHFQHIPVHKRHSIKVLNPGCGLGRFAFELACAGYTAEGCELSYHMVIGAMFVMNHTNYANQYKIYPWANGGANHLSIDHRLRSVEVPDVCPRPALREASKNSEVPTSDRIGIASGDFVEVYKRPENENEYDVLAMIFFLDTAKNPLEYFETAVHCLKPGGIWMNIGPLKWHHEMDPTSPPSENSSPTYSSSTLAPTSAMSSMTTSKTAPLENPKNHTHTSNINSSTHPNNTSEHAKSGSLANPHTPSLGGVEFTEEDIKNLLVQYGFRILHYEAPHKRPGSSYVHDHASLEINTYYSSFWVARKLTEEDKKKDWEDLCRAKPDIMNSEEWKEALTAASMMYYGVG